MTKVCCCCKFCYIVRMKKIILLALFVCAAAFADSYTDPFADTGFSNSSTADNNSVYSPKPKKQGYRNSFFMSFDIGPSLVFSSDIDDELSTTAARDMGLGYVNVPSRGSYSGSGFGAQAKLGILFKQFVAVYAIAGAFESSGTYEMDALDSTFTKTKKYKFNDASASHFYGGLGTLLYPFRDDEGFINGLYFAFDFGLNIGGVSYDNHDGVGSMSTHLQLEVGKEFDVAKRWKLGFGLAAARMSHFQDGGYSEYSLQLNFHVTRR